MKRFIVDKNYNTIAVIDDEPECSEHFCDHCGDCLLCYKHYTCYDGSETRDEHEWVTRVEKFELELVKLGFELLSVTNNTV